MAARRTKRADGRYAVTVTYEDESGVKRRHFAYGKTQAEAKDNADKARQRLASGAPVRDATRTLTDWLTEWRTTALVASNRAASTKDLYDGLTRRHVDPTIGHLPIGKVRPVDVTRMINVLAEKGLAQSTQRNVYAALRGALDDAVANGLIAANPVAKVKRPKVDRHEAHSLELGEVEALIAGAESLRYASALKLILMAGLRRGEALALRWDNVDLDRREAAVRGSLVRRGSELVVAPTKTAGSRRTVSLSASAITLLKAHRAAQAQERLTAGNQWEETGFVFTTEFGRPADPRNLLRAVTIAARNAGLDGDVGVHTLRHTYATTALLNGVPLHVVSRNLGHASIAITADVYGHLTDKAAQEAADIVSSALGL